MATYSGAWFEVRHPAGFRVRPSLPSLTAAGVDSAFFDSPDGAVSFYVCAPQWGREPVDIAVNTDTERMVDEHEHRAGDAWIRRYTVAAKDGSYRRSYRDTTRQDGSIRWVVGIRFRDQAAYEHYLPLYRAFKESLVRFAD